MKHTTLCYIEKDGAYLLLHRVKKEQDANAGKWIGIGGHLEEGETAEECLLREVYEETGLTLTEYRHVGDVSFYCEPWPPEVMHLFHATAFRGSLCKECREGVLRWVDKGQMASLPMWEGDKIFLKKLEEGGEPFTLSLYYEGERLAEARFGDKTD